MNNKTLFLLTVRDTKNLSDLSNYLNEMLGSYQYEKLYSKNRAYGLLEQGLSVEEVRSILCEEQTPLHLQYIREIRAKYATFKTVPKIVRKSNIIVKNYIEKNESNRTRTIFKHNDFTEPKDFIRYARLDESFDT